MKSLDNLSRIFRDCMFCFREGHNTLTSLPIATWEVLAAAQVGLLLSEYRH